ncbi:glycosyltransferase [Streptomyces sioyaensis]|uniref:glycosyltransferase family 2 protein n=1 Tax=Streptomyces sioyaensis TaxID=67364 RepID=UPI001F31395F|nr:glycosyltransferase [Streptomyces sioyaensis]MCF3173343.1 glycosyltransferase [Streptomyces sioyaensis]
MPIAHADVAVITPTRLRPERRPYLMALYESLCRQDASWEWVVSLDGVPLPEVPARLREDPRVRVVDLPRAVGAGAARNFALNEVSAEWCTTADDDDLLPEGALSVRLAHARAHALGWAAGWSADLHPDGSTVTWRCPTPPGFHAPGEVWGYWRAPEATIPLGPTTLLARTDLIRGCGGYAALPQGEDYAYLVGVTGVARGALVPTVVYHYRKHPEQMTAQPGYPLLESRARQFAYRQGEHLAARYEAASGRSRVAS